MVGRSWKRDQALYLRTLRTWIEAGDAAYQERAEKIQAELPRWALMSKLLLPAIDKAAEHLAGLETRRRMALAAIELRRYRREHGHYPASWPMLTDPFTGEPLGYEVEAGGFVIWSAGRLGDGRIEWRWE